jgi:hypothetical protein
VAGTRHNVMTKIAAQPAEPEAEETTDPFGGLGIDV